MVRRGPVVRHGSEAVGMVAKTAAVAGPATAVANGISASMDAGAQAARQQAADQGAFESRAQVQELQAQMAAMQTRQAQAALPATPATPHRRRPSRRPRRPGPDPGAAGRPAHPPQHGRGEHHHRCRRLQRRSGS
jgi:hypothetical protein